MRYIKKEWLQKFTEQDTTAQDIVEELAFSIDTPPVWPGKYVQEDRMVIIDDKPYLVNFRVKPLSQDEYEWQGWADSGN